MPITIKDIAQRSGYAVGTVSRVLNGHPDVSTTAREKIMAVVEETGFRPNGNARHLKQRESREVAIVVKGANNLLFARILEETQRLLKAEGRPVSVFYLDEEDDEAEQALRISRELKPMGVLFLGGNRGNFQRSFGRLTLPSVLVTTRADTWGFPNLSSVSTDDREGSAQAVSALLEAGHREIGVIGGESCFMPPTAAGCNTSQLRLMGCQQAHVQWNVPFDPQRQCAIARYSMEGGYEAAMELLKRLPNLTAIFAMSDVMAIGAVRALGDRGVRVPEDMSVIGYDGIEQALYSVPRLATVCQDWKRLARRSVEILLRQVESGTVTHKVVPFRLSMGESVSGPKEYLY